MSFNGCGKGKGKMKKEKRPPVHPGEILLKEFLEPMDISQSQLAEAADVDKRRINDIVRGRRAITGDTAVRLAHCFGTSVEFWMNLQKQYEIRIAKDALQGNMHRLKVINTAEGKTSKTQAAKAS
jgi:addiction module HigA family antidote